MPIFPFQIIAIKLFSVSPSEMCDERTASKLSAFNSAKRNGLSPANLINMAKLQDYWRYGLGSPGSEHSATLKLPKAPKSTSVHLPAPTLQDLLNPALPDEEPEFLIADPYGIQALGAEEDDEEDGPVIIHDSDLIRLEIEDLINLQNTKLQSRYMEDSTAKPMVSTLCAHSTTAAPRKFTNEDWSKDDFLF
jgi:hypothetical protein